jgi:hypothetical protein
MTDGWKVGCMDGKEDGQFVGGIVGCCDGKSLG